jgi:hypothetical protein
MILWMDIPKYIDLLFFSVQFCGASRSESSFLKFLTQYIEQHQEINSVQDINSRNQMSLVQFNSTVNWRGAGIKNEKKKNK